MWDTDRYTNYKEQPEESRFIHNFEIFVRVLRWSGYSLVRWNKLRGRYEQRFWDKYTLRSALLAFYFSCLWCIYVSDFIFGIQILPFSFHQAFKIVDDALQDEYEEKNRAKVHAILVIALVSVAVLESISVYLGLFGSPGLCGLLNSFDHFENVFKFTFPERATCSYVLMARRYRNSLLLRHILIPGLIYAPLVSLTFGVLADFFGFLFIQSVNWTTGLMPSVDDAVVLLCLRTLREEFRLVHDAILENQAVLTTNSIAIWRKCICTIRNQITLASACQANQQLWLSFGCVELCIAAAFLGIHNNYSNKITTNITSIAFVYIAILFHRLFLKISELESLQAEEAKIAMLLTKCKSGVDAETAFELSFLIGIIEEHPSNIIYGDYVQLGRQLILGIISQSITYLIFLEQL